MPAPGTRLRSWGGGTTFRLSRSRPGMQSIWRGLLPLARGFNPLLITVLAAVSGAAPLAAAAAELRGCAQRFDARSFGEAQDCFAAYAAQHPDDAEAAAYLGRAYLARRQPRPAIEWLKKAVARAPGRSDLHDWLGQAYGIAAERALVVKQFSLAVKARKEFERAVELDAGNPDACEDLIEFQIEAPPFLGGSFEQAKLHAAELARREPLRGRLAHAGIVLHQQGPAAAQAELQAAAAEFPRDPRPDVALAAAYSKGGQYERAFEALDAALRLDPDNADARDELARVAALSGQRLDQAEELLGRCLARLPAGDAAALADCHLELAAVLERHGDPARARDHYQAALRLDPASPEAQKALRRLH